MSSEPAKSSSPISAPLYIKWLKSIVYVHNLIDINEVMQANARARVELSAEIEKVK